MSAMKRILKLMAEKHASDVYLSGNAVPLIKINGTSVSFHDQALAATMPLDLLSEIASKAQIEELKETGELNMSVQMPELGIFRISAMRQRGSYALVIRYIPSAIPPFDTLHLPAQLTHLVMAKMGLILMVGSAGSGKSTTLASMLEYRNERITGHILTIEDPIEYLFTSKRCVVNQREVGIDTKTLQIALENGLRQAPDVFFIGEIRDRETMTAAITYAQTGHLCIATLHANNSYQTLNRILSFYPVEVRPSLLNELSTTLKAVISQRLVKTVNNERRPAVEIMLNTQYVSEMVAKGDFSGVKDAMQSSLAEGSQTFEDDLARMIREGIISRKEGLSFADSPTNLIWRLDNTARGKDIMPSPPAAPVYEPAKFEDIKIRSN